ncbi:SMI1 / KNR4 family (SUKH-1) [Neorhodopirellula lusitana]|uniref:SMI1 / KNR4 family (SUKH-1) n=1 Tax=Neorhodopirellula lusitana TaxID=445327 RepID=A0ABY1QQN9_9BACT|nr:SMI1/KNR4 family protein [Neorhodopirellula lusitana]SMP78246.1 SMI1 / KNR4 family (SUKH-1) [Neorhodopirellula lusitana]
MPDWKTLVDQHHSMAHPDGEYNLVTGPPASDETLANLETALGFKLPPEFRSFYSSLDGFGIASADDPSDVSWFFRPCGQIDQFSNDVREWFKETHERCAKRFFPFIDWLNGDGIGYMLDESGDPIDGVFEFNHELYKFDSAQDVNEFLRHVPAGIQDFLSIS